MKKYLFIFVQNPPSNIVQHCLSLLADAGEWPISVLNPRHFISGTTPWSKVWLPSTEAHWGKMDISLVPPESVSFPPLAAWSGTLSGSCWCCPLLASPALMHTGARRPASETCPIIMLVYTQNHMRIIWLKECNFIQCLDSKN